jgi:hypothetical protein
MDPIPTRRDVLRWAVAFETEGVAQDLGRPVSALPTTAKARLFVVSSATSHRGKVLPDGSREFACDLTPGSVNATFVLAPEAPLYLLEVDEAWDDADPDFFVVHPRIVEGGREALREALRNCADSKRRDAAYKLVRAEHFATAAEHDLPVVWDVPSVHGDWPIPYLPTPEVQPLAPAAETSNGDAVGHLFFELESAFDDFEVHYGLLFKMADAHALEAAEGFAERNPALPVGEVMKRARENSGWYLAEHIALDFHRTVSRLKEAAKAAGVTC